MKYKKTEREIIPIFWKDLLLEKNNKNIKPFLKWNGDIFISELYGVIVGLHQKNQEIRKSKKITGGISMDIEVAVHVNCNHLITFTEKDFPDLLDYCIKYFEQKEDYERCAKIFKLKNEITNSNEDYQTPRLESGNSHDTIINKFFG